MTVREGEAARFGVFELDLKSGELRRSGLRVRLPGQPFEILRLLLEKPGELITREELRRTLWPSDTFVDFDHGLNAAVNKLREALGDSADSPRYVETIPRRGYRFLAPVERVGTASTSAAPEIPAASGETPGSVERRRIPALAIAAGALAALLVIVLLAARARRDGTARSATPVRAIAVLPFEELDAEPGAEYFADGMTEALITRLSQIGALPVVSRTSVMRYRGSRQPLSRTARELGVDAVIEGTVQRSGGRVRISARLVAAAADRTLWAESYERDFSDVLALQSEVARAVAEEVRARVTPEERARLSWAKTVDPEAYRAYLRGRYFLARGTGRANQLAEKHFRESLAKDPSSAATWAGLAEAEVYSYPPREAMPRAKEAALRAVELDPEAPESHAALGLVQTFWDRDWKGAEQSFRRALALAPNASETRCRYAQLLAALGRFDESIAQCRQGAELDPLNANLGHLLGRIYYFARRNDLSTAELRRTLELDPNSYWANFFLAVVSERDGRYDDAVRYWGRAAVLSGVSPSRLAEFEQVYRTKGYRALLQRALVAEQEVRKGQLGSSSVALRLAALGEKDEALNWLERAYESHTRDLVFVGVDPGYDPLRGEPRFAALVRRIGLPERLAAQKGSAAD
jgi:TolB-like protein/DNA-binding winged helix-turn-helix (wHTH) protein/cytochrome c-type biogenesis protein CcmH/NrfG